MEDFSKKELEDYFCRFTFGQFVTLILLEIVTLFFVFYLGSRYGSDILGGGRDERAEVKSPEPIANYPEILSGSEAAKSIRVKPSGVTIDEYEKGKKQEDRQVSAEPTPEHPVEVLAPVTPAKEPAKEVATGRFTLQVGSYQSEEEARRLVDHWKGRGYSSFMAVGEIPDRGTWYRVRIGNFKTRKEAEQYLKKFQGREKVTGLVVPSKS